MNTSAELRELAELKPCPFCGVAPELNPFPFAVEHKVTCRNEACAARPYVDVQTTDADAIAKWNTRAFADAQEKQEPDAQLCTFYQVKTFPELVAAMVSHIEQLQERNRKLEPRIDYFQRVPREG